MRLTPDTVAALAALMAPLDTPDRRAAYLDRRFPRGDLVKDLDKRYRWDLFYAARGYTVLPEGTLDSHVDTALRRIIPSL